MESPCTNHAYPVKHLYKDCELLKRFLRESIQTPNWVLVINDNVRLL